MPNGRQSSERHSVQFCWRPSKQFWLPSSLPLPLPDDCHEKASFGFLSKDFSAKHADPLQNADHLINNSIKTKLRP